MKGLKDGDYGGFVTKLTWQFWAICHLWRGGERSWRGLFQCESGHWSSSWEEFPVCRSLYPLYVLSICQPPPPWQVENQNQIQTSLVWHQCSAGGREVSSWSKHWKGKTSSIFLQLWKGVFKSSHFRVSRPWHLTILLSKPNTFWRFVTLRWCC